MATGHFFKKNTDASAPALTNVAGSLITVLDWVLDVGTGTHWEKVYTGTNKAVYRATTGNRFYLRVDDTLGETAYIRGYESMTDVDTGTNPFPMDTQQVTYARAVKKEVGADTRWWAVGDSQWISMLNSHDSTYEECLVYWGFGDVATSPTTDNYNTLLVVTRNINNDADYNDSVSILNQQYSGLFGSGTDALGYWARDPAGVTYSPIAGFYDTLGWGYTSSYVPYGMVKYSASHSFELGHYLVLSSSINSGITAYAVVAVNNADSFIRAKLPYLYSTPYVYQEGLNDGDIVEFGTSDFELMYSTGQSGVPSYSIGKYMALRVTNDEPDRV